MIWLSLYVLLLFASCLKKSFRHSSINQYYICGRNAGVCSASFSLLASIVGGSATLGMIGLAWKIGTPAFWWLGSGVAGLLILGFFLARKVRQSRAKTMPEILEKNLGQKFRYACSIIILVAYVPIVAAQLSAQAILIAGIGGINQTVALYLGAFILFAYTAIGGQAAVMKSDVWQFVILLTALGIVFCFCLSYPQGISALAQTPLVFVNQEFPPVKLAYYLFILGGSFVVGPMLYGRLLSSSSQRVAKHSCLISAGLLFIIALAITVIGISLQGILPAPNFAADFKPQDILNVFVQEKMPPWASVPILLGLLSAIVSSADSCLFTAASIGANDLLKKPDIRYCRALMFILTVAACLLTMRSKGILNLLLMANDIYVCGVVPPVFMAILLGGRKKIQSRFLIWAVACGGCMGALASWLGNEYLSLLALAISFALSFMGFHNPKNNFFAKTACGS